MYDIVARVKIIGEIKKIMQKNDVEEIVVWLPYDIYGKKTRQYIKTEKFIEKLNQIFKNIKIVWVDERYTTIDAERVLLEQWKKFQSEWKDAISALFILESYVWLRAINE